MKNRIKWLVRIIEILVVLYVVIITLCILCKNSFGFTKFGKYTITSIDKDMNDYILKDSNVGNLLVIKASNEIKEGDIIYYYSPIKDTSYSIKSSVVLSKKDKGYVLDDSKKTFVENERMVGRGAIQIPVLGTIFEKLETKVGFLIFVLLPIVLVFIHQVYKFIKDLLEPKHEEIKESKKEDEEII